jgi:predicted XRE-type DNA-binding protein
MTTKKTRSAEGFTTLDSFLEEEGVRDAFQAVAVKEVLSWQIKSAMESQKLSQARLAKLMGTSRSQSSGAEESRLRALPKPDMSLSTHPAPIVQPRPQVASAGAELAALT